jgi:hypothetical protein
MQILKEGVLFDDYIKAHPNCYTSTFTDKDGATLIINTTTLIHMYELCKFELTRRGEWDSVMVDKRKERR